MSQTKNPGAELPLQHQEEVVIRFAGDSGDGMQITGNQFTHTSAIIGNDLATFPDYPAEIRAPAGTLPGVSGYQIRFSSANIMTPGDQPDVLVVMNPASASAAPTPGVWRGTDFRHHNGVPGGCKRLQMVDFHWITPPVPDEKTPPPAHFGPPVASPRRRGSSRRTRLTGSRSNVPQTRPRGA